MPPVCVASAGPRIDDVTAFAKRLADLGWHLQIHMEASLIAELASDSSRGVLGLDFKTFKGLVSARPFFMSHRVAVCSPYFPGIT
jgi:hypothetical protein